MKTLRFIHTADWHASSDPVKQKKLKDSLEQILGYVQQNEVEAIIHCGDVWDSSQDFNGKGGVPIVFEYLRKLSKHVNFIFIVKGNNSHDAPGSISLLHQLETNIYAYEYPVVLGIDFDGDAQYAVIDLLKYPNETPEAFNDIQFIVSLIPYPTKASFISDQSIDNNNSDFLEKFEQIFELIGDVTQPYTCPKILGAHLNVVGSRLSSGQSLVSQDIMVAPSTLDKAGADYVALGHIHFMQEIKPFMVYSGGIYNKNWGEPEPKSIHEIIISENGGIEYIPNVLTAARPMIKIEAIFKDGEFEFDMSQVPFDLNPEVRFRYKVSENDKNLITDEKLNQLKEAFGKDVKIEGSIVPNERESRSEQIMNCKTLRDEVTEYGSVIDADVFSTGTEVNFLKPSIITKIDQIQEEVVL